MFARDGSSIINSEKVLNRTGNNGKGGKHINNSITLPILTKLEGKIHIRELHFFTQRIQEKKG